MTEITTVQMITAPETQALPGEMTGIPLGSHVPQLHFLSLYFRSETKLLAYISMLKILTAELSACGQPFSYINVGSLTFLAKFVEYIYVEIKKNYVIEEHKAQRKSIKFYLNYLKNRSNIVMTYLFLCLSFYTTPDNCWGYWY